MVENSRRNFYALQAAVKVEYAGDLPLLSLSQSALLRRWNDMRLDSGLNLNLNVDVFIRHRSYNRTLIPSIHPLPFPFEIEGILHPPSPSLLLCNLNTIQQRQHYLSIHPYIKINAHKDKWRFYERVFCIC